MRIRPAHPEEAAALSELCFHSKAHWGYDDEFMEACREELTVRDVAGVRVAEVEGRVVGLYSLDAEGDVALFFVDSAAIGTGVGRALWDDLVHVARVLGLEALRVDADPNAEGFYARMGAVRVGEVPSASIPGRTLPCLRFDL